MAAVGATYFDGRSARLHNVTVTMIEGVISVDGDGIARREPLAAVALDDVIGDAPRVIRFSDGAVCEVRDSEGLRKLLATQGVVPSVVSQWEGHVGWIAAGVVAFMIVLALGYWYGIPVAARVIAERVPDTATRQLSGQTLAMLDGEILLPSELPQERRDAIVARYKALAFSSADAVTYEIQFRKSPVLGANALALPGGPLVLTDELVALARDEREVLAVLAHEAGHVRHRHSLRTILQNSLAGFAVAWFIGDIGTLASAAPAILIELSYSRDLERDADAYAVDVMRANDIPIEHFANILRRLGHEAESGSSALRYLSSHPATEERLQRLQAR